MKNKSPERIRVADLSFNQDQLNRYQFAANLIKDFGHKKAIDCACGEGYGTELLSIYVKEIVGVDIDKKAITVSKGRSKSKNAKYYQSSIYDFESEQVDLFVSLETIEHVNDGELFLRKIKSVLKKGGTLILSTPNGRVSTPWGGKPRNKFHIMEYFPEDLISLVSKYFKIEAVYGQYPKSKISLIMNVLQTNSLLNRLINILYQSLWRFYKSEDKPILVNVIRETIFKKGFSFSTNVILIAKNE